MKKDRYTYVAIFNYDDDGLCVEFPDLPGCVTFADKDDTEAAIHNAKEAMGLYLFDIEESGSKLPSPTNIRELKINKGQAPVLIDVFMPSIRARIQTSFVKKTLSLPAWLSAKADEDGVNCSKLFQEALIEYLQV